MTWEGSVPVGFQAFHNYHLKNNATTCNMIPVYWSLRSKTVTIWEKIPDPQHEGKSLLLPRAFPDLNLVRSSGEKNIFPKNVNIQTCTLLLTNLAEAEWLNVNCSQKLLPHILCAKNTHLSSLENSSYYNQKNVKDVKSCLHTDFDVNSTCYAFVWLAHQPKSGWHRHNLKQSGLLPAN